MGVTRAAGACLGVAALAVACTSTGTQIADKISAHIKAQGITPTKVTCDKKTAKKGDTFNCTATADGTDILYKVVMTADDRFDANTVGPVFLKSDLEKLFAAEGKQVTGLDATVDCGPKVFYTKDQVTQANCTGTVSGVAIPLKVTLNGDTPTSSPAKPVVIKAKTESEMVTALKASNVASPSVDCGPAPIKVIEPGATFTCEAKAGDGSTATLTAKLADDGSTQITNVAQH
jgi:hypothetical protein